MRLIGSSFWELENKDETEELRKRILEILKKAKEEKGMSLEKLGKACDYGKSQMGKYLNGQIKMPSDLLDRLVKVLDVNAEVEAPELLEMVIQTVYKREHPDMDEASTRMEVGMLISDEWEYNQLDREQEQQLEEMKQWFMDMEEVDCYLLDTHYKLYEKGELSEDALEFIQNYEKLEPEEKKFIKHHMKCQTISLKDVKWLLRMGSIYFELAYQNRKEIAGRIEDELTYKGTQGECKSVKAVKEYKERHWESFCSKIKDSSYGTGTYFYRNLRLLVRMDTDMWEALAMFALLGDNSGKRTELQNFFVGIRP